MAVSRSPRVQINAPLPTGLGIGIHATLEVQLHRYHYYIQLALFRRHCYRLSASGSGIIREHNMIYKHLLYNLLPIGLHRRHCGGVVNTQACYNLV